MAGLLIATAIGGTALTGAAVASGIAGGIQLASGIKSFSEANKAKKRQAKAEREAEKAMEDARRRTEVNVMERLSIKKEPYEQQVMALLTQGQAGLQAGVEGEQRGAYRWRKTLVKSGYARLWVRSYKISSELSWTRS